MKKWLSGLLFLLLTVSLLSACGEEKKTAEKVNTSEETEQTVKAEFPVTIKDGTGEEVVIKEKPEKIVSIMPSNTEIAYELGLWDQIVGVTSNDVYPKEVSEKEVIGDFNINVEKIISLSPDLVLAHASSVSSSADSLQQLKDAGITVLAVNEAKNFDQVYESIEMIGKATGKQAEAAKVNGDLQDKLNEIQKKASAIKEPKSVLIEIDATNGLYVAGKNTFLDEMLKLINAKNVIGDLDDYPVVEQEELIKRNPDVIITTYGIYVENAVDKVKERSGWQNVTAVKNNQVYDVDPNVVTHPSPRLVEGVEELAKAIYPEVFK